MRAQGKVCSGVSEIVVHELRARWLRATKCAIGDVVKREREVGTVIRAIALSRRAYGVDLNRHTTERKLCRSEKSSVVPCVVEHLGWIRLSGTRRARCCRRYSIPPRSSVSPTTIGIIDDDPCAVGGCKEHRKFEYI